MIRGIPSEMDPQAGIKLLSNMFLFLISKPLVCLSV